MYPHPDPVNQPWKIIIMFHVWGGLKLGELTSVWPCRWAFKHHLVFITVWSFTIKMFKERSLTTSQRLTFVCLDLTRLWMQVMHLGAKYLLTMLCVPTVEAPSPCSRIFQRIYYYSVTMLMFAMVSKCPNTNSLHIATITITHYARTLHYLPRHTRIKITTFSN